MSLWAAEAPVEPAPDRNRGLYAVRTEDPQLAGLPFIKGGQVVVDWKTVEPAPGRYDFSNIDEQLAAIRTAGRVAIIQIDGTQQPDTRLIAAFSAHLRQSPMRSSVLGVRLSFDYRWQIVDEFIKDLTPEIRVFVENNVRVARMAEAGRLALFHTSSELEPRDAGPSPYDAFIRYCRSGQTVCYAESPADSWGRRDGPTDPRWCSPAQWNYWRLLSDLNSGVSFIGVHGNDLANAGDLEFRAAFEFASRYAGYHASPSVSPGAWVALREGNTLQGDYSFLMSRLPDDPMQPLEKAGPEEQRFGAWARRLSPGAKAHFRLRAAFARSLDRHAATVSIVYLDQGAGSFIAEFSGKTFQTELKGSGRWKTAILPIEKAAFREDAAGAHVTISADSDLILHMIEVRR